MDMQPYIVYVCTDVENRITAVDSSAFLLNPDGWTEIDRGYTQCHHHAQGNYFNNPIMDDRGVCRYKLVDGKPVERTQEEMDAEYDARPAPEPTTKERVDALETTTDDIILMMAELIGG